MLYRDGEVKAGRMEKQPGVARGYQAEKQFRMKQKDSLMAQKQVLIHPIHFISCQIHAGEMRRPTVFFLSVCLFLFAS